MVSKVFSLFFLVFVTITDISFAQELQPQGGFLSDSIKVGKEIVYSLSIEYPKEMTIVFPDSTYNFTPFEFKKKKFFETRTQGGSSFDSVVYYLSSFELDSIQTLSLPVFIVNGKDSTAVFAGPGAVLMETIVPEGDGALKETTSYLPVDLQFNYAYLLVAILLVLVILITIYLIFGKQIRKKIKLYRLKKAHNRFLDNYISLINDLKQQPTSLQTEKTLFFWKKYMEKLDNQPYTKLTTKEIAAQWQDQQLSETLRSIDRIIYGNYREGAENNFYNLKGVADERYNKRIEEVQNA